MNEPQPWWLTWPVAEVAAAILPLFANSDYIGEERALRGIVSWSKTGSFRPPGMYRRGAPPPFKNPHIRAFSEAIQVLEQARLLLRGEQERDSLLGLTRLGWHALQTNTVRQHLGLGDAPPTA